MKKLLLTIAAGLAVLLLPVAMVSAAPSKTTVKGTVTLNGNPVNNASVTVTCNGNVLADTTGASGKYSVVYSPDTLCPAGAKPTVSATSGSNNGSNSGTVDQNGNSSVNVAEVNVSLAPEFGILAGTIAAVGAGTAFFVIPRRKLSVTE